MSGIPATRRPSVLEVLARQSQTDLTAAPARTVAQLHGDTMDVVIDILLPLVAMLRTNERLTPDRVARRLGAVNGAAASALLFPKTLFAAPGTLHSERVRCGKPNCRCADGVDLHTATWHVWQDGERQRREYVAAARLAEVQAALQRWRERHPNDGRRSENERARKRELAQARRSAPHRQRPFTPREGVSQP